VLDAYAYEMEGSGNQHGIDEFFVFVTLMPGLIGTPVVTGRNNLLGQKFVHLATVV